MRFSAIFPAFLAWFETSVNDNDVKSNKNIFSKSKFVPPFYLTIATSKKWIDNLPYCIV